MRPNLLRIENLLLLVPICATGVYLYSSFNVPDRYEEFYAVPTEYTWLFFSLFTDSLAQWISILLTAYLMHYFLRSINRRNKTVCFIHAVATTIVMLYRVCFADFATSVVPGWHTTIYPPGFAGFGRFSDWLSILFWLMQVLFILHGVFIIHKWKRTGSKP